MQCCAHFSAASTPVCLRLRIREHLSRGAVSESTVKCTPQLLLTGIDKTPQVGGTASRLPCPFHGACKLWLSVGRTSMQDANAIGSSVGITSGPIPPLSVPHLARSGGPDRARSWPYSASSFGAAHQKYLWRSLAMLADTPDPSAFAALAPTALSDLRALEVTFKGYGLVS